MSAMARVPNLETRLPKSIETLPKGPSIRLPKNDLDKIIFKTFQKQFLHKALPKADVFNPDRDELPTLWHHKSPRYNEIMGTNFETALNRYGEAEHEVVVAVLDSGFDVNHQGLRGKIWINQHEIPNNGVDDDQNGYTDDIVGWNFLGSSKELAEYDVVGPEVTLTKPLSKELHLTGDTLESTRDLKRQLAIIDTLSVEEQAVLRRQEREMNQQYKSKVKDYHSTNQYYESIKKAIALFEGLGLNPITQETLELYIPQNPEEELAKEELYFFLLSELTLESIFNDLVQLHMSLELFNLNSTARKSIVQDNPQDLSQKFYGNNDVSGMNAGHGTHIAGIINSKGPENLESEIGLAKNAKLMLLKIVPWGDERDKDVANAIYYAVDNGADIINMSFGKYISPHATSVSKALVYAQEKGVLIVSSAGNDSKDIGRSKLYPRPYHDGKKLSHSLIVAAANALPQPKLNAYFSNYSGKEVDLFAPGVDIFSLQPGDQYEAFEGTSQAAPIVASALAFIKGHFPRDGLSIMRSVKKSVYKIPDLTTELPNGEAVLFSNLSRTGGIIDIDAAMQTLESSPFLENSLELH